MKDHLCEKTEIGQTAQPWARPRAGDSSHVLRAPHRPWGPREPRSGRWGQEAMAGAAGGPGQMCPASEDHGQHRVNGAPRRGCQDLRALSSLIDQREVPWDESPFVPGPARLTQHPRSR